DQPGLIPDDPVAGVDLLPAALDLAPDLPEAFRLARVRGHVSAEAREVQLENRIEVPHCAVDHDAGDALHETRVRGELAPDRRRPTADVDHDHVRSGVDLLPAALDLAPDLPEAFRLARVRGHVSAEAREVQLENRIEVPHCAVDHDAGDALHETRVRGELAPDRRRPTADVDHDHV